MANPTRRLEQRRRDARSYSAQRCGLLALALLAASALGCGSDGSQTSAPTPAPALTPQPAPTPGCGNGIVDEGEFCDGESFCTNCTFSGLSACCQFSSPDDDGLVCLEVGPAGAQACTQNAPGGTFVIGATCAGEPCANGLAGCHRSQCEDETIAPVSLCCQRTADHCTPRIATSVSDLATFVAFECNNTGEETSVVGTCDADGRCVPGH